jgi:hypothetical protein
LAMGVVYLVVACFAVDGWQRVYMPQYVLNNSVGILLRTSLFSFCLFLYSPFNDLRDLISSYFGERGWNGMDWICLAQDRDQWRALVNTVMNLLVP